MINAIMYNRHKIRTTLWKFLLRMKCAITRRQIWVFTSWSTTAFADNPRHFYEYLRTINHKSIRYWIVDTPDTQNHLLKRGIPVVCAGTAKATAISDLCTVHAFSDVAYTEILQRERRPLLANLWHGMPMKDIGTLRIAFDFIASTSFTTQSILCRIFCIPAEKAPILGEAKNDVLFKKPNLPSAIKSFGSGVRVITYMPTYRGSFHEHSPANRSNGSGFLLQDCIEGSLQHELHALLETFNSVLLLKPHRRNKVKQPNSNRILLLDDTADESAPDSHEILAFTDILITDYSSVYFSFLLKNKPIIMFAPDLEAYTQQQKLLYSYEELANGNYIRDEEGFLAKLRSILELNQPTSGFSLDLAEKFYKHLDGDSCNRTLNHIEKLLMAATAHTPADDSQPRAS